MHDTVNNRALVPHNSTEMLPENRVPASLTDVPVVSRDGSSIPPLKKTRKEKWPTMRKEEPNPGWEKSQRAFSPSPGLWHKRQTCFELPCYLGTDSSVLHTTVMFSVLEYRRSCPVYWPSFAPLFYDIPL